MPPPPCLDCRRPMACWRGLCRACYGRLAKAVARGHTTFAQTEQAGLCLPRKPRQSVRVLRPQRR